ncbi:CNH domain-containing protein [Dipodascopsis uninucleata]
MVDLSDPGASNRNGNLIAAAQSNPDYYPFPVRPSYSSNEQRRPTTAGTNGYDEGLRNARSAETLTGSGLSAGTRLSNSPQKQQQPQQPTSQLNHHLHHQSLPYQQQHYVQSTQQHLSMGQQPLRQGLLPRQQALQPRQTNPRRVMTDSNVQSKANNTVDQQQTTQPNHQSQNQLFDQGPPSSSPLVHSNSFPDRLREKDRTHSSPPSRAQPTHVPSLPVSSYSFSHPHAPAHSTIVMASRGKPLVYPAFISAVAEAFVRYLQAGDRVKDGLTYKNAFTGAEAVDLLLYILQTPDRTLALLLGRALDALKLFHDVTYNHKLRDHQDEVYQLRETMEIDEQTAHEEEDEEFENDEEDSESVDDSRQSRRSSTISDRQNVATVSKQTAKNVTAGVTGIFMLMTECYSPTCTRSHVCYAVHCPKRLEQQFRAREPHNSLSGSSTVVSTTTESTKVPTPSNTLKRQDSRWSLNSDDDDEAEDKLWIHSVSQEVAESVDEKEKKRQEVICELIYTERDFVKDLEYLRDFWIKPLRTTNVIPEHRREKFIRTVFSNAMEVHSINSRLAEALTKRQQQAPVVYQIGDIMLEYVPKFVPFIRYGANQLYGKYEFEREKSTNPLFAKFVEDTERLKESRKLELNGYLTKPTTRLARYPLFLEAVLRHTSDDSPDMKDLRRTIDIIREFLTKVNLESGKAANRFDLMQLSQSLVFPPGEYVDLKLTEEGRRIIFRGYLKKRLQDQQGDVLVYLLDYCLLFVRVKVINRREQRKVFRKPIPLELLVLAQSEEGAKRPSSSLIPSARSAPSRSEGSVGKFPITFTHLGRRGYELTLYSSNFAGRKKWIESIEAQQRVLRERSGVFVQTILCKGYFDSSNRVNCAVPLDGGRKMLYGTDSGVYMSETRPARGEAKVPRPQKMLAISNITQLDILEEYSMLLALSDKTLVYWSLDTLDTDVSTSAVVTNGNAASSSAMAAARRPKRVATHINFFKSGVSLGRLLVCTVKTNAMTTTIRALEPEEPHSRGKKQTTLRRLLQGQSEGLKVFKDFYIPSEAISLSFLKSKVCVGCSKGFEIISLETLDTQSLLDPADTSLDFVVHREGLRPIAIYRLNGDFLLNYSDFSFFVNRNGWRSRPDWMIHWEGLPQSFALSYPYILAFEPSFIEIRHVESGALVHIVTGENIRFLHENINEILYVYEDDNGYDVVAWLDFWGSVVSKPNDDSDRTSNSMNGVDKTGRQRLDD